MELNIYFLLLWVTGWIFACGYYASAAKRKCERISVLWHVFLFFAWPHFLGYALHTLHYRVMSDGRRMVNIVEDRIKP